MVGALICLLSSLTEPGKHVDAHANAKRTSSRFSSKSTPIAISIPSSNAPRQKEKRCIEVLMHMLYSTIIIHSSTHPQTSRVIVVVGKGARGEDFRDRRRPRGVSRSPRKREREKCEERQLTSSGRGAFAACLSSFSYCAMRAGSTCTSGGARAGAATNSRPWLLQEFSKILKRALRTHPTSFRASQRNGFSKLY